MSPTLKSRQEKKEKQQKDITTIKLEKNTKARLDHLKIHPKESYEEIIRKILGILNLCKINPMHAKSKLSEIDRQREINGLNPKNSRVKDFA